MMYTNESQELITIDELCNWLNIGKNAAYTLLNSGEIKAFKIGRVWKIPQASISDYIIRKSKL